MIIKQYQIKLVTSHDQLYSVKDCKIIFSSLASTLSPCTHYIGPTKYMIS